MKQSNELHLLILSECYEKLFMGNFGEHFFFFQYSCWPFNPITPGDGDARTLPTKNCQVTPLCRGLNTEPAPFLEYLSIVSQ